MNHAMPVAFRMRTLYPLIDGDGSCTLIYDLERAVVIDVPEELQFHVAPALETGEPDEDLLSWLMEKDLYTSERSAEDAEDEDAELAGDATWSGFAPCEGELVVPVEHVAAGEVPAVLDLAFKQGFGAARIALRLSWGGAFPGDELLSQIVAEASRRAAQTRQEVRLELALDAWVVTPAVADFLAAGADSSPLHVRLHCGTFPAAGPGALPGEDRIWGLAERGVRLLAGLAERLTVQCVLAGPARLHDLWRWARQAGVRHLDATRLELAAEPLPAAAAELGSWRRLYRGDLMEVAEDICRELGNGGTPIDFQPLTRSVRRLMRSELPLSSLGLCAPEPPLRARERQPVGDAWPGLDGTFREAGEAEGAGGPPCSGCWARYLCEHSELAASADRADRRAPTPERCAGWLLEVEVALRLHHRLAQLDVLEVRRLFEEAGRMPAELGAWRGGWQPQKVAF